MGREKVRPRARPRLSMRSETTRVLLLAWSYEDARFARTPDDVRHTVPGPRVRLPEINAELWMEGSYAELQWALETLRAVDPVAHLFFWQRHVVGEFPPAAIAPEALRVVTLMKKRNPNVYVPPDVAKAAGYLARDAKEWARPSLGRRAA